MKQKEKQPVLGLLIIIMLLLEEPLSVYIAAFSYVDDFLAFFGWGVFVWGIVHKHGKIQVFKDEWKIFLCFFTLLLIGIVGNIVSGIPRTLFDILREVLNFTKFWAIFILMESLFSSEYLQRLKRSVMPFFKFYILFAIVFCIANQLFDTGMSDEIRFGIRSFTFIYSNSGSFSNYCVAMLCVSTFADKNIINKYSCMSLILLISTLRFKALGVAIFFCVYAVGHISGKIADIVKWIVACVGGLAVGVEQIEYYFGSIVTPRKLFLVKGIKIANDYFPLGSGLGTFGTSVAANDYSPLYFKYGMANYWFFTNESKKNFMNDNFWPAIMAQYGWFGLSIYVAMLWYIYKMLISRCLDNRTKKTSVNTIFICILIASMGGPILFGQYGAIFFAILPLIIA